MGKDLTKNYRINTGEKDIIGRCELFRPLPELAISNSSTFKQPKVNKVIHLSTGRSLILSIIILFCLVSSSCSVNYSMTGASIAPDVKTINIRFFQKTAGLGPASLGQTFTETLKDKFISQTNLSLVDRDADLTLEGNIPGYTIMPLAIQANETAAQNRLSITVNVKFTNLKDEKQNFESAFTRFADFESTLNISSIEDQLIKEINEQIIDDIFNKAVINW
ncbi:MAG TPA: LptE family protein [Bacteroidia bacterium]|nr:LptE family protein [Bacteroidia bacterium]